MHARGHETRAAERKKRRKKTHAWQPTRATLAVTGREAAMRAVVKPDNSPGSANRDALKRSEKERPALPLLPRTRPPTHPPQGTRRSGRPLFAKKGRLRLARNPAAINLRGEGGNSTSSRLSDTCLHCCLVLAAGAAVLHSLGGTPTCENGDTALLEGGLPPCLHSRRAPDCQRHHPQPAGPVVQ